MIPKLGDWEVKSRLLQPVEGWKENTLYLVHVCYGPSNPVHEDYFQVGFLDEDGTPGNYTYVVSQGDNLEHGHGRWPHYLRVIKELHTKGQEC